MPCLGIFGLKFKKPIVIFKVSTVKFVKNESSTHTVNFGIGSAFSRGSGSAFLKDRARVRFIKYAVVKASEAK